MQKKQSSKIEIPVTQGARVFSVTKFAQLLALKEAEGMAKAELIQRINDLKAYDYNNKRVQVSSPEIYKWLGTGKGEGRDYIEVSAAKRWALMKALDCGEEAFTVAFDQLEWWKKD